MFSSKRIVHYLKLLLFAAYFINGILAIRLNSPASDESDHISYGIRMLKGKPQKVRPYEDASTMPVSALNALPRAAEQLLKPGLQKKDYGASDAINGRYITLLICSLIGLFIYRWSKELFGERAGLFSLFLFVFCPNSNAHINLVGTDAYAMLCTLTSAYYFRKFVLASTWKNLSLFSSQVGLSLIAKQSLFLLPLVFGFIALIVVLHRGTFFKNFGLNVKRLLVLSVIVLLIINIAFLFSGTGQSLSDYHFRSDTFQQFQSWPLLNKIPLPLPAPFIEGFDLVKQMLSMGSGHGEVSPRSYLFGKYFTGNSVWYYYSVCLFFKTPLPVLLLLVAVIAAYIKTPFYKTHFFTVGFPLALSFFFILFISFNNTSQHGIRHLLMIYPLWYVCMGQVVNWKFSRSRLVMAVLVLYSLATFYFYFPNLLSYTNELIGNKKNAYKVLASVNIDMGQSYYSLEKYLQKHTDVSLPPTTPQAGNFIVGINEYLDLKQTGQYTWLQPFEPYGHVNHCYLLFRVTEADLLQKHLK